MNEYIKYVCVLRKKMLVLQILPFLLTKMFLGGYCYLVRAFRKCEDNQVKKSVETLFDIIYLPHLGTFPVVQNSWGTFDRAGFQRFEFIGYR